MSRVIEIIDSDDDNQTSTSLTTVASTTNMDTEDSPHTQSRRRPRKSALNVMRDADMQFVTIAVEDDDRNSTTTQQPTVSSSRPAPPVRPQLKNSKTTPKILAAKPPTTAEIIEAAYEEFVNTPEAKNDIYAIALERLRINYLLSMNGMPEINFSLYTQLERLQFQFEERLKQRKMVHNWDASRLQENRGRSLLQNNNNNNGQD